MASYKKAVIIGGYATGYRSLERVSDGFRQLDLSAPAQCITLYDGLKNPADTLRAMEDSLVVPHSAGVIAMIAALESSAMDCQAACLAACNPPNSNLSRSGLIRAALRKDGQHLRTALRPAIPYSYQHFLLAADHAAQLGRHPIANARLLRQMPAYNTYETLDLYVKERCPDDTRVMALESEIDEYGFNREACGYQGALDIRQHMGGHDQLFINPLPVLKLLQE